MPVNSVPILPPPPGGGGGGGGGIVLGVTTAPFVVPACNATVLVQVNSTAAFEPGDIIFIQGAGFFAVESITDATNMVIENLCSPGNAAPGTVIPSGSIISEGDAGFSHISVANEAELTALPTVGMLEGQTAFVESHGSYWKLETTSIAIQPHEIIADTSEPTRRWLRLIHIANQKWAYQFNWDVDPVAGHDENSGAAGSGFPIKTFAEGARRLMLVTPSRYQFNLVGGGGTPQNIPPSDRARFQPTFLGNPNQTGNDPLKTADIRFFGQRQSVFTGTMTAATNGDASIAGTLSSPTFTDLTAPAGTIAANIGNLVEVNDDDGQKRAWILEEISPGVARVTEWIDTNGVFTQFPPITPVDYDIYVVSQWQAPYKPDGLPNRVFVQFVLWNFTSNLIQLDNSAHRLISCTFTGVNLPGGAGATVMPQMAGRWAELHQQTAANGGSAEAGFINCLFFPPPNNGGFPSTNGSTGGLLSMIGAFDFNGTPDYMACGFINCLFTAPSQLCRPRLVDAVFRDCIYRTGRSGAQNFIGIQQAMAAGGSRSVFSGDLGGVGFFNSHAALAGTSALIIQKDCALQLMGGSAPFTEGNAGLYGLVNGPYGLEVEFGGTVSVQDELLAGPGPGTHLSLTGSAGQILLNNNPTPIPPLVAGAVVPAASPMTTWAQWQAAPFSRNVFDYSNGSKIITVPVPFP